MNAPSAAHVTNPIKGRHGYAGPIFQLVRNSFFIIQTGCVEAHVKPRPQLALGTLVETLNRAKDRLWHTDTGSIDGFGAYQATASAGRLKPGASAVAVAVGVALAVMVAIAMASLVLATGLASILIHCSVTYF